MHYFTGKHTAALLAIIALLIASTTSLAVTPANEHFQRTWERTDAPVAGGVVSRTWMWGPAAFAEAGGEPYDESPDGQRTVQYFDKSRMEITNPEGDSSSPWYVTTGLLVVEMVTGKIQTGAFSTEERDPAGVNVAGDAGDPAGPTYQTIGLLRDVEPHPEDAVLTSRIDRQGVISDDPTFAAHGVTAGDLVPETGHRVASVFWEFMTSAGIVYDGGSYIEAGLFENAFYATGLPITEAYWTTVQVGGSPTGVLLQCFERRCLTYTPDNQEGWQVEAGNVGRHYYEWRYGPIPTATTGDLRVVDIYYDPIDEGDRSGEYVTIRSFDPYPVDMTGWTLIDDSSNGYTFPAFVLQPGAELRVYNCTGTDTSTELFTGRCTAWWNNSGDTAFLSDAQGRLVSQYGY